MQVIVNLHTSDSDVDKESWSIFLMKTFHHARNKNNLEICCTMEYSGDIIFWRTFRIIQIYFLFQWSPPSTACKEHSRTAAPQYFLPSQFQAMTSDFQWSPPITACEEHSRTASPISNYKWWNRLPVKSIKIILEQSKLTIPWNRPILSPITSDETLIEPARTFHLPVAGNIRQNNWESSYLILEQSQLIVSHYKRWITDRPS